MRIEIANQQTSLPVDEQRLADAARAVVAEAGYADAVLSLAVVDDPTIHELNRRTLDHDYPTDVLSFVLDDADGRLEGEVVVSADTALANASEYGWAAEEELLLYVIHGVLHLVGYGDKSDEDVREMRAAERRHLALAGVTPPVVTPGASPE